MIFYLNGKYIPAEDAALPLGDLAIVRGFGVFDYLRTYERRPFMLREHVERLQSSAAQIGLDLPWSLAEIEAIVRETNDRNDVSDAGIRIVVTGGESTNYMIPQDRPSIAVMLHQLKPYPASYFEDGVAITTTDIPRFMPTVKSLNYLGAIIAVREAEQRQAIEAVYRTVDGRVTEGTRSNLFVLRDGVLITPVRDILPGITRIAVIEAVTGAYEVVETDITYDELLAADELFLTSTTKEVMPIARVDEHVIGSGRAGECTRDIAERFRRLVQMRTSVLAG